MNLDEVAWRECRQTRKALRIESWDPPPSVYRAKGTKREQPGAEGTGGGDLGAKGGGVFWRESGDAWLKPRCWAADDAGSSTVAVAGDSVRSTCWRGAVTACCVGSTGLRRTGHADRNADNSFKAFCCKGCREMGC